MPARPFAYEGRFPTTHWSLVVRAGQDAAEAQREALEQLLRRYLPALHAHLVHTRRVAPDEADDLLQDFVASRIIEKGLLGRADQELGKFRSYLLAALDRFLIDQRRRQGAQKRSPGGAALGDLGEDDQRLPAPPTADAFDLAWARTVLDQSLDKMRTECAESGRDDVWGVFESRLLAPILHRAEPADYEELVGRFGLASAAQASNVLITAKRMFARIIRAVVGEYALGDEEIETEIRELHTVLGRASGT